MITLISILVSILFACLIALAKYCQVRKRSIFAFSFFVAILVFVTLVVTGDITIASAN
jgi:hypothetical protein